MNARDLARRSFATAASVGLLLFAASWSAGRDLVPSPERPGGSGDDPIRRPKDLTGMSIKCPRVRAVSSADTAEEGATGYLFARDPWMAWARGREMFLREFSAADGAFGEAGKLGGQVLEDQATKMMNRDHVSSCAMCHNVPFRDAGAGVTIQKNSGSGRNTTHAFGAGLQETLGWQLRLKILERGDINRDGWIGKGEADRVRAIVDNLPAAVGGERVSVDFGTFGDLDGNGKPDLNPVCFIHYVDHEGKRISWARGLGEPGVAGYTFEVQLFGWGHRKGAVAPTLRAFSANAFDMHAGLQAYDPILSEEPNGDSLAHVSLAGMPQFISGRTRDRGVVKDDRGVSREDPDRDGVLEEITSGDLDLIEWYQLNHPSPAEKERTAQRERGRRLITTAGCTSCHVPDWHLEAGDPGNPDYTRRYLGDRRFFDMPVAWNPETARLEGRIERRDPAARAAFTIRGVYSDFAHHDLGPAFHQMQYDGSVLKKFRTAPLWGAGSTAPYGHDGASLDLDDVIRRHGGEAAASTQFYAALPEGDREAVLAFLRGLVLYGVDTIPCDVNADGRIEPHFQVAGMDTGLERCNPEWLFRIPGRIEGMVLNPDGVRVQSFALTNVEEAYGGRLKWLRDDDGDGFPDARFATPGK
ncbi:MAG: hypothetical protein HUU15_01875 [Candidatus Brocadiae bacterium]|nr:hypothetical protein [Candidatus Brocadiia bacterium]